MRSNARSSWGVGLTVVAVTAFGGGAGRGEAQQPPSSAERGTLGGLVVDRGGAPVAGAEVRIPALDRGVTAAPDGSFHLRSLPLSRLVVTVRALGHQPYSSSVTIAPAGETRLEVRLEAASVHLVPVVVSAGTTTSDPTTPLDVAAIGPAELRSVSTASLGRTLERIPGVATITTGPAAGNPVLRGMSQGQVRLTRDGVPVETFQGTSRWTPPISFGSVDRVEVIRGPASVLYGSSAMGGAINFLPKILPRSELGRPVLDGMVETQYFANNDERYINGELSGALAGGAGFRAGYSRRVAGDFRTAAAPTYDETQRTGDPRFTGVLPHTNYGQRSGYGQLGYGSGWGQVQLLYDGFQGYNNFINANGRPTGVAMANHEMRLRGTVLRGPFVVKPSLTRQLLRIQRAASVAKTFEEARAGGTWDQDLSRTVTTGRVEIEHAPFGGISGKGGLEVQQQRGVTRLSRIEPSSRMRNVAAFVFEEYRWPRVTLSSGVRYDSRTQRARLGSLVSALPDEEHDAALNRRFSVLNGSLGAGVRLTRTVTWTTNLSSGFRAPAVQDLYTDENRPAFGYLEGNPHLRPERSLSLESSLRVQGARAAGTLTAYRNTVANYIYLENTGRTTTVNGQERIVYTNAQADGVIRGIEAGLEASLAEHLVGEASYMALRSVNRATGEALPLMPSDQMRAALRWSRPRLALVRAPSARLGWRHSWAKRIAGPTEPFAEFDTNPLGFGISSTPAYSVWELGVGGRVGTGSRVVDVSVDVQNLLDTPYRDFLDTQKGFALAQGRNVSVRLSTPFTLLR